MIDFWLVFCQMIPFAEVVLLTAIEYQRAEEEEHGDDLTNCVKVAPINNEEVEIEKKGKRKRHQKINMTLLIPNLKTLGKFQKPASVAPIPRATLCGVNKNMYFYQTFIFQRRRRYHP